MRIFVASMLAAVVLLSPVAVCLGQEDTGPVMIKINRILLAPGNKYAIYIPTFEFHMLFQREFDMLKSAVTADYDYRRQDMGFGMSHALFKYAVNPGVNVDDNLYFREVFTDSTGIWRRKQSITPFLMHKVNDDVSIGLEFKFEREWAPRRRMGARIVSTQDRSLKLFYSYRAGGRAERERRFLYVAVERSYKIFHGEFNYFLIDVLAHCSHELSRNIFYRGIMSYRGNLTPQESPIFFLGGRSNLIGYENDELWGRRTFYFQNLFEFIPFPTFGVSKKFLKIRRVSLLTQFDLGRVRGAASLKGMKRQSGDLKMGVGFGVGFNTDLPYMPSTDVHLILAVPSDDLSNVKFYAGFGGWGD